MSTPGNLKASELTAVAGGTKLATATAARWNLLKAAAKRELGRTILPAGAFAGYRSAAVQNGMHHAGCCGTYAQKVYYRLNPRSTVSIAAHPNGTHETGTRVDVVGTVMDTKFLNLAARYGFKREFGAADPNHFKDYGTYKISKPKKVVTKVTAPVKSKTVTYVVKPGDTYAGIALDLTTKTFHVTAADLQKLNPKTPATALQIGQKIRVA